MTLNPEFVNFMCELVGGLDDEPTIRTRIEALGYTHRYTNLTPDDPNHAPWFSYHFIEVKPSVPESYSCKTYSAQYTSFGLAANLAARKVLTGECTDKEEFDQIEARSRH